MGPIVDPLYYVLLALASPLLVVWWCGVPASLAAWWHGVPGDIDGDGPRATPLFDRDGFLCELLTTTPPTYGDTHGIPD